MSSPPNQPGAFGFVGAVRAWWQGHAGLVDAVLALSLWVLTTAVLLVSASPGGPSGPLPLLLTLSSVQTLSLAWRRSRPGISFVLIVTGHLVQLVVTDSALPSNIAALLSAYAVARYSSDRRVRSAGLSAAVLGGPLAVVGWQTYADLSTTGRVVAAIYTSGMALLCWFWGDLTRKRRELVARLREQNQALRRDRDQRARIAAQDERTRIAREMHDIVAHSLSVVVVQADGAAYRAGHAAEFDRDSAREALTTIGGTARGALTETRRLVGVLRTEDEGGQPLAYAPTAALTDLGELVGRMNDSGVPVDLRTDVDPATVPQEISLAAYRIVQEALTNVIKHAGASATAQVRLHADDERLHLSVVDDGRGAAAGDDGHGHGLIGMRERASSTGGRFSAGPAPAGGYRVTASLPFVRPEETP